MNIFGSRSVAGLTQAELAAQLKMSRASINAWERDKAEPSFTNAIRVAKHLNFSIDGLELPVQSRSKEIPGDEPVGATA